METADTSLKRTLVVDDGLAVATICQRVLTAEKFEIEPVTEETCFFKETGL